MTKPFSPSRRNFLTNGLKLGGGLTALLSGTPALAELCGITIPQQEGPYYPEGDLDRDADLVQLKPGGPLAKGTIIRVVGTVTDEDCRAIPDALVEIWQACHSGKYNHSEDPNSLELDPNFQYWGRARTDQNGRYEFRSVIPGYYPNTAKTYRPPHIHFKTHAPGHQSLTTQMYFDPDSFADPKVAAFVKRWNDYERVPASLIISFKSSTGKFDIALKRLV